MQPSSKRRLSGGVAALIVIGSTLLATAGGASAGQTRILDIRSPGSDPAALTFTPVSAGGVTKTDIQITNNGKQNLTMAHLLIGVAPAGDLPTDVTVADVFDLVGAGTCSFTTTSVDCDFGSLTSRGPGKTRTVSVALNVGAAGPYAITAAVKVAETVQDVGSNSNTRTVSGSVTPAALDCDKLATYIVRNHGSVTFVPETVAGCESDTQRSSLEFDLGADSGFVLIDDSAFDGTCPDGYTCFGKDVVASVNGGATIEPYLTWRITYSAELMGSTNPRQVSFAHGDTIIPAGKKGACGVTFTKDCIVGWTEDEFGTTFEIRTATNIVMKGLK